MSFYIVFNYTIQRQIINNVSICEFLTTKYFVGKNSVYSLLTFTFASWFLIRLQQ